MLCINKFSSVPSNAIFCKATLQFTNARENTPAEHLSLGCSPLHCLGFEKWLVVANNQDARGFWCVQEGSEFGGMPLGNDGYAGTHTRRLTKIRRPWYQTCCWSLALREAKFRSKATFRRGTTATAGQEVGSFMHLSYAMGLESVTTGAIQCNRLQRAKRKQRGNEKLLPQSE
jgi:hypothetical protein